jgi:hypothetical protein
MMGGPFGNGFGLLVEGTRCRFGHMMLIKLQDPNSPLRATRDQPSGWWLAPGPGSQSRLRSASAG